MFKVLFVCTGNICRSPTAEAVFRSRVKANHLETQIVCDSAGIEDFHEGDPPDGRAIQAAMDRGYSLGDLRARQIRHDDFERFDLILALDDGHLRALSRACPAHLKDRIKLFLEFSTRFC